MKRVQLLALCVAASVVAILAPSVPAGAAATVPASTPIGARIPFAQTNGDILAVTKVAGASRDLIAFGGNFSAVITPDGVSHSAKHFAVVDEDTGALVYAGNASSYVRTITSLDGIIYVGGDFTSFGGVSRNHLAALSPSFAVTSWNPSPGVRIYAALAGPLGVYYGGDGGNARLSNFTTGATIWSQPVSGGSVRSIGLSPDEASLYVGGLFEVYGGLTQHGLVKANPATGAPVSTFNANLKVDSTTGPHAGYDGEEGIVIKFSANGQQLLAGIAGYGSDEFKVFNPTTGALIWRKVIPGDCQGVGVVGTTYVVGYHRNNANGTIPYPYFASQLEASNGQLTDWDPKVTGNQSNADGGNNGVQAIYADPVKHRLFLAGAFTSYNGTPLKSLAVYSWGAGANLPPTASFTTSVQNLTASFNAGGSSDPDGQITSYAWNFGDGAQGTGVAPQHTYAAAGTYTVTLQVTDNQGATNSTSAQVSAPPSPLYAQDSFSRTVSNGLGTADLGGTWTVSGSSASYSVSNGAGHMSANAGTALTASLDGVKKTSTEVSTKLSFDKAPTGGGVYAAVVGRRISSGNDYRVKLRVQAGGAVTAQLVRVVSGTETVIQNVSTVPGLTYAAGNVLQVRFQVSGTGTTQLAAKVWMSGTAEPAPWLLQATDTTAALQSSGSVGLWTYLSTTATQVPMVMSVDDFTAGPVA
ncbi:MAG: PKD domain-containing protein [Acidimicrobiia bacterium]